MLLHTWKVIERRRRRREGRERRDWYRRSSSDGGKGEDSGWWGGRVGNTGRREGVEEDDQIQPWCRFEAESGGPHLFWEESNWINHFFIDTLSEKIWISNFQTLRKHWSELVTAWKFEIQILFPVKIFREQAWLLSNRRQLDNRPKMHDFSFAVCVNFSAYSMLWRSWRTTYKLL